jgi:saccharopine dehydrogenase-like NADP-dependent oxidoreductase
VGSCAAGHDVVVADADIDTARSAAKISGSEANLIDAEDTASLRTELERFEIVVSAIPYRLGLSVATAALTTGTHYLDFGGNPTVVTAQKHLHNQAVDAYDGVPRHGPG